VRNTKYFLVLEQTVIIVNTDLRRVKETHRPGSSNRRNLSSMLLKYSGHNGPRLQVL